MQAANNHIPFATDFHVDNVGTIVDFRLWLTTRTATDIVTGAVDLQDNQSGIVLRSRPLAPPDDFQGRFLLYAAVNVLLQNADGLPDFQDDKQRITHAVQPTNGNITVDQLRAATKGYVDTESTRRACRNQYAMVWEEKEIVLRTRLGANAYRAVRTLLANLPPDFHAIDDAHQYRHALNEALGVLSPQVELQQLRLALQDCLVGLPPNRPIRLSDETRDLFETALSLLTQMQSAHGQTEGSATDAWDIHLQGSLPADADSPRAETASPAYLQLVSKTVSSNHVADALLESNRHAIPKAGYAFEPIAATTSPAMANVATALDWAPSRATEIDPNRPVPTNATPPRQQPYPGMPDKARQTVAAGDDGNNTGQVVVDQAMNKENKSTDAAVERKRRRRRVKSLNANPRSKYNATPPNTKKKNVGSMRLKRTESDDSEKNGERATSLGRADGKRAAAGVDRDREDRDNAMPDLVGRKPKKRTGLRNLFQFKKDDKPSLSAPQTHLQALENFIAPNDAQAQNYPLLQSFFSTMDNIERSAGQHRPDVLVSAALGKFDQSDYMQLKSAASALQSILQDHLLLKRQALMRKISNKEDLEKAADNYSRKHMSLLQNLLLLKHMITDPDSPNRNKAH